MSCNKEKCTCPEIDCDNYGKCCKCINSHKDKNSLVHCMREIANKNK